MTFTLQTLEEIGQLQVAAFDDMPLGEIAELIREVGEALASATHYKDFLLSVVHHRYSAQAQALRQQAGKTTGTVRFEVDGHLIISDLPKRTEYDQNKLRAAIEALRKWGEDPDKYVTIEIKVPEAKYNAWPPAIQKLFEPARTVKVGKPIYRIEPVTASNRFAQEVQ